jgi:hypothetical protein
LDRWFVVGACTKTCFVVGGGSAVKEDLEKARRWTCMPLVPFMHLGDCGQDCYIDFEIGKISEVLVLICVDFGPQPQKCDPSLEQPFLKQYFLSFLLILFFSLIVFSSLNASVYYTMKIKKTKTQGSNAIFK